MWASVLMKSSNQHHKALCGLDMEKVSRKVFLEMEMAGEKEWWRQDYKIVKGLIGKDACCENVVPGENEATAERKRQVEGAGEGRLQAAKTKKKAVTGLSPVTHL